MPSGSRVAAHADNTSAYRYYTATSCVCQVQKNASNGGEKYDIKFDTILKYLESFVGNLDNKKTLEYALNLFVDKIFVYKEKMVITFHFTDDRQELSYGDTLEMIENHKYLMDCVNDPEAHVVDSPAAAKMRESILSVGGTDPDFFP